MMLDPRNPDTATVAKRIKSVPMRHSVTLAAKQLVRRTGLTLAVVCLMGLGTSAAWAVKIGDSAYNQNCARCHGLQAISGGIAPDLRKLDNDCVSLQDAKKKAECVKDVDVYYLGSIRNGKVRNGAVYMPKFEGVMNQEAMWSIKAYLETVRERPL